EVARGGPGRSRAGDHLLQRDLQDVGRDRRVDDRPIAQPAGRLEHPRARAREVDRNGAWASSHARRPSMPVSKRAVWPWSKRRSATAVRSSVAALPTWASDSPIVWALEPPVPTPITTRPGARSCRVAMALAV